MAAEAAGSKAGRTVIRNIGLLLSGDIDRPILDADIIVAVDSVITAIGEAPVLAPPVTQAPVLASPATAAPARI